MRSFVLSQIWAAIERGRAERPPLNYETAEIGKELGPFRYVLDADAVSRYAGVMGVGNPLFPTTPARHTGILRDSHYRVDGGGINARTEVELFRPPRVDETIVVTGGVIHRYVRRGKPYITQMAVARAVDGTLIERVKLTEMRHRPAVADKWHFLANDG